MPTCSVITARAHDDDREADARPGRRSLRGDQGWHRHPATRRKDVPQQRWVWLLMSPSSRHRARLVRPEVLKLTRLFFCYNFFQPSSTGTA
jgi:hypothetical protein